MPAGLASIDTSLADCPWHDSLSAAASVPVVTGVILLLNCIRFFLPRRKPVRSIVGLLGFDCICEKWQTVGRSATWRVKKSGRVAAEAACGLRDRRRPRLAGGGQ